MLADPVPHSITGKPGRSNIDPADVRGALETTRAKRDRLLGLPCAGGAGKSLKG